VIVTLAQMDNFYAHTFPSRHMLTFLLVCCLSPSISITMTSTCFSSFIHVIPRFRIAHHPLTSSYMPEISYAQRILHANRVPRTNYTISMRIFCSMIYILRHLLSVGFCILRRLATLSSTHTYHFLCSTAIYLLVFV